MAKKKKQPAKPSSESANEANGAPSPNLPPLTTSAVATTVGSSSSKASKFKGAAAATPALIICRNKHWRYISSFHGPWLQLPPEILETLSSVNYSHPRPRPVDPAVFFDLVKIRHLVDEATDIAVRAASGMVSSSASPQLPGSAAALGLGFGQNGRGVKMSAERRHRLRMDATQRLSKAFHIDEIASSVATMQGASTLEDVASLVLERNPDDPDAKYVHFFHEKIPSRHLAECTSLQQLDEVIAQRPSSAEPLRTRATIRVFKGDYEGAATDLTEALRVARFQSVASYEHGREKQVAEGTGRRKTDPAVPLNEDSQPSSLEMQLLFHRAGVYLAIACQHVRAALPEEQPVEAGARQTNGSSHGGTNGTATNGVNHAANGESEAAALKRQLEARKQVRANAKRALRDYMAFLAHFDYTPSMPVGFAEEFARKVSQSAHFVRTTRAQPMPSPSADDHAVASPLAQVPKIYTLNELFSASPPTDLPEFPPPTDVVATTTTTTTTALATQASAQRETNSRTETVTFHPLLTDAMHSLLLAHALVQTSAKELLRHAYMVARLTRITDGYPVFQLSRSPARADWIEVLRCAGGDEWIQLAASWEGLCAPAQYRAAEFRPDLAPPPQQPSSLPSLPAPPSAINPQLGGSSSGTRSSTKSSIAACAADDHSPAYSHPPSPLLEEGGQHLPSATPGSDAVLPLRSLLHDLNGVRSRRAVEDLEIQRAAAMDNAYMAATAAAAEGGGGDYDDGDADEQHYTTAATTTTATTTATAVTGTGAGAGSATLPRDSRRFVLDDNQVMTERAVAVARWVLAAPPASAPGASGGAAARRKKKGKKTTAATTRGGVAPAEGGGQSNAEDGAE